MFPSVTTHPLLHAYPQSRCLAGPPHKLILTASCEGHTIVLRIIKDNWKWLSYVTEEKCSRSPRGEDTPLRFKHVHPHEYKDGGCLDVLQFPACCQWGSSGQCVRFLPKLAWLMKDAEWNVPGSPRPLVTFPAAFWAYKTLLSRTKCLMWKEKPKTQISHHPQTDFDNPEEYQERRDVITSIFISHKYQLSDSTLDCVSEYLWQDRSLPAMPLTN